MERKLITKNDILLIALAGLVVVLFFVFKGFSQTDLVAEVYYDGEVVDTVNLGEKEEKKIFTGENDSVVIVSCDGKIHFESSPCPDKVCVRSGRISKAGEGIICAPNRVAIEISGKSNNPLDALTG